MWEGWRFTDQFGGVDFVHGVAGRVVILVRAGEELHRRDACLDKSCLIAGIEVILHGVDGNAGDKTSAAQF